MSHPVQAPAGRGNRPAVAGYVVLTAAFLWPAVRHFPTRVLSSGGDGSTFVWAWWYMPRAVARLDNPFTTTAIFHPVGANLAFHSTAPLELVLTWPLARLAGPGAAVNLVQLAAAFLSAFGAYLLALRVCGDRRAAFFAGAAFAFLPYRFVHAGGHFNLIHAEFLPFGLLALLRLLDRPSRGRAATLGAVVGLTFLTDFYLTVFLLLALAVMITSRRREALDAPLPARLTQAGLMALVVALPLIVPMVGALRSGELDPLPRWGGAEVYSADLFSWVVPPENHPWWGSSVVGARDRLSGEREGLAYPGLVVLGLAVAGRELANRERRRGWVALAGVAGLLALGPFLHVAGATGGLFNYLGSHFAVPLPLFVVHFVPILNGIRVPGRLSIVVALALDVLAALALAGLARARPRRAWVITGAAFVVTVIEFLPGALATHPKAVPRPYHVIAADRGGGAVLEIPLQWQTGVAVVGDTAAPRDDTIFMYYATVHERPLVSGYISRYPAERLRRLTAIPLYRQVLSLGGEPGFDDPATFGAEGLRSLGIGYVVYHRDRPQPRAYAYVAGLDLPVLADDGTIVVWRVP